MSAGRLSQKRILVVDDSKFVRTTFRGILSAAFEVQEEADGEAAWRVISSDPAIAMVFTDLDMPVLDGFGLLARMRGSGDPRIRRLPVIVIAGDGQASVRARAREAGASDFIWKSADAPEILSRIEQVVRLVQGSDGATPEGRGALTPQALLAAGRKQFAAARRPGGELSVMALRVDNLADLTRQVGRDPAEELVGRIAKMITGAVRAADALARTAPDTFVLLAPGTPGRQMSAIAGRLREQLLAVQARYRDRSLKIACSFGVASLAVDPAGSIEELIRLALQRLAASPLPAVAGGARLGEDVERALRLLEAAASRTPPGQRSEELLARLRAVAKTLQGRQK